MCFCHEIRRSFRPSLVWVRLKTGISDASKRIGIECHFGHCMQILRRAVTTENSMTNIFWGTFFFRATIPQIQNNAIFARKKDETMDCRESSILFLGYIAPESTINNIGRKMRCYIGRTGRWTQEDDFLVWKWREISSPIPRKNGRWSMQACPTCTATGMRKLSEGELPKQYWRELELFGDFSQKSLLFSSLELTMRKNYYWHVRSAQVLWWKKVSEISPQDLGTL